jgi:hypothetical protein
MWQNAQKRGFYPAFLRLQRSVFGAKMRCFKGLCYAPKSRFVFLGAGRAISALSALAS